MRSPLISGKTDLVATVLDWQPTDEVSRFKKHGLPEVYFNGGQ